MKQRLPIFTVFLSFSQLTFFSGELQIKIPLNACSLSILGRLKMEFASFFLGSKMIIETNNFFL